MELFSSEGSNILILGGVLLLVGLVLALWGVGQLRRAKGEERSLPRQTSAPPAKSKQTTGNQAESTWFESEETVWQGETATAVSTAQGLEETCFEEVDYIPGQGLQIGQVLEGKYHILATLGQGGMGRVFLAQNLKLGNKWAIKEIDLSKTTQVNLLAEPEILKKLNHPSIPRIVDIVEIGTYLYIIEDYVEGITLGELLRSREHCTEPNVIRWAKQLSEILFYLHRLQPHPIIYRDLKPGNIIIDAENNAKLVDFGIAREYKQGQESDTTYIGTRGYAAPELYAQANQSDERTDIYSLGVTLYHVLTGRGPNEPPYYLVPVRSIDPGFSEGIEKILAKCVQDDPGQRYQSVQQLLGDLHNIHKLNRDYQVRKIKQRLWVLGCAGLILGGGLIINHGLVERDLAAERAFHGLMQEVATLNKQGNFTRAEELLQGALYADHQSEINQAVASIYLQRNENERAIQFINEKLQSGEITKTIEVLGLLGSAYFNLGDYKQSIEYFGLATAQVQQLGADQKSHLAIYRDLAVSYGKLGDFTKAESILTNLLAISDESDPVITYISGEISSVQGNYTDALAKFDKACTEDPSNIRYKLSYVDTLCLLNGQASTNEEKRSRYEQALALLAEAAQQAQHDIQVLKKQGKVYYDFGLWYQSLGDARAASLYREALTAFNKIVSYDLASCDDYINIGIINNRLGNLPEAEAAFKKALAINPDNSRANLAYGLLKINQKQYQGAYPYLQKTVNLNQSPGDVAIAQQQIEELRKNGHLD